MTKTSPQTWTWLETSPSCFHLNAIKPHPFQFANSKIQPGCTCTVRATPTVHDCCPSTSLLAALLVFTSQQLSHLGKEPLKYEF